MSAVHSALAARYCAPEWATVFEVRDAAGFNAKRSADAVSMALWPSRGLQVLGFEIKVSRSDWLRELKDPAKSAPVQAYCDRWIVAVSDDKIVREGELPPTWGLMVLRGGKLVTITEAPQLEAKPLSRTFVAMVLRRATENVVPKSIVDTMVAERVDGQVTRRVESWQRDAERAKTNLAESLKRIADFEAASGVSLGHWEGTAKVGAALRLILESRGGVKVHVERVRNQLRDLTSQADAALADLATLGADPIADEALR